MKYKLVFSDTIIHTYQLYTTGYGVISIQLQYKHKYRNKLYRYNIHYI